MLDSFSKSMLMGFKNLSWRAERWQAKFVRKNEVGGKQKPVVDGKIYKRRNGENIPDSGNGVIDDGRRSRR